MFRLKTFLVLAMGAAAGVPAFVVHELPAHAQKKEKAKGAESDLDLEALKAQMESGDAKAILAALGTIEKSKDSAGAPLVDALLVRGGPTDVIEEAIKVAGKLKSESSSAALAPYTRHRNEGIRRHAASALIKTGGAAAVKALRQGLRSSDPAVRGVCATGLGTLGAREAMDDLFRAFDAGVGEAAASLGQLCQPEECEKFAERTGVKAFDIMISGFDQILFRPPKDMTDDQKIRIIGRLRELGTAESGKYLADVAGRWPKDWSAKVKQALDAAAKATGGGS
jgi:hypothetical protein